MKTRDVIHYYLGCDCMVMGEEVAAKIKSVWHDGLVGVDYNSIGETEHVAEDVFPLLRPLSSMTEEEAKDFIKKNDSGIGSKNISLIIVREYEIEIHVENTTYYIWFSSISPQEYIWLITKSFDIFGLIESQQAIDITKLNKDEQ